MKEPKDPNYRIFRGSKPEPKVVYELPDGTTTVWLNEYVDAMVQDKVNEIVKLLEEQIPAAERVGAFYTSGLTDAIKLIKDNK